MLAEDIRLRGEDFFLGVETIFVFNQKIFFLFLFMFFKKNIFQKIFFKKYFSNKYKN